MISRDPDFSNGRYSYVFPVFSEDYAVHGTETLVLGQGGQVTVQSGYSDYNYDHLPLRWNRPMRPVRNLGTWLGAQWAGVPGDGGHSVTIRFHGVARVSGDIRPPILPISAPPF